jgi:pyruvate, water dikinase
MHASESESRSEPALVRPFRELGSGDLGQVGGKNASLGEMIRSLGNQGVRVPDGFATTSHAYRRFLAENGLEDPIRETLAAMDAGDIPLAEAGERIRRLIRGGDFSPALDAAIRQAYQDLCRKNGVEAVDVAVRSSATAEDLPDASFAGQQDSFLNVTGEEALLETCLRCYASLFTDRAIDYRRSRGFDHMEVALSVGVQRMVRSDRGCAGVIFTLDPDGGFPGVVVVTSAWGLGEAVVQGTISPDQYLVFKALLDRADRIPILERERGPKEEKVVYREGGGTKSVPTSDEERRSLTLTDDEVLTLARWSVAIEEHYGTAMDIEWAKDGDTGELFIVQARPETVHTRETAAALRSYELTGSGEVLAEGAAIGSAIATGRVSRIDSPSEMDRFQAGTILVTGRTDPDWGPILNQAAGIITDQGGRTSHAAIVSRELGIPAVVGTGNGTSVLEDGMEVTLSCAEGDRGRIYRGAVPFRATEEDLEGLPEVRTDIMMNIGNPAAAFRWWRLPTRGVGLARMEFIIGEIIRAHPMALLHPEQVEDPEARERIRELTRGYGEPAEYFVDHLARGIGKIAAVGHPHPVVVRLSDFKTNEYAQLIGGESFEPHEENPMLGFRGACRYYDDRYREAFALECEALRRVRSEMGLENVVVMVPFCRTLEEADRVLDVMAEHGLRRGEDGLQVYVMCEVPSNVMLAPEFAQRFDGFSIGSNDLTQLVLGVDRDSGAMSALFDERNEAVVRMIRQVIRDAHAGGAKVGICGQAPSDHPGFAEFLVEAGIDSISLNPDSVPDVIRRVAEVEKEKGRPVD